MPYVKRPKRRTTKPKRKGVQSSYRRKTYRKTRPVRSGTQSSKSFGIVYKNRMFTRFTYETGSQIYVPALQINGTHFWRTNSIYDPDYSNIASNVSVVGYSQAAALYNNYRVYGAIVTFSFTTSSTTTFPIQVVITTANDVSSGYAPSVTNMQMANRPGARSITIYPQAAGGKKTYKMYFANHKIIGISKEQYRTDYITYSALNGNPTWLNVFALTAFNAMDYTNAAGFTLQYHMKITYLTELFDLKEQTTQVN